MGWVKPARLAEVSVKVQSIATVEIHWLEEFSVGCLKIVNATPHACPIEKKSPVPYGFSLLFKDNQPQTEESCSNQSSWKWKEAWGSKTKSPSSVKSSILTIQPSHLWVFLQSYYSLAFSSVLSVLEALRLGAWETESSHNCFKPHGAFPEHLAAVLGAVKVVFQNLFDGEIFWNTK